MTLIEKINAEVAEFQRQIAAQPLATQELADKEEAARQLGQRVAQLSLAWLLAADGTGYRGPALACACGGRLRYQRDATRPVRSLVGEVQYARAYYYCRACGASRCPLDEALQQSEREISAGVERQLANLSAHVSFPTASSVLSELAGVPLSARQVETVAEAVGARAASQTQVETEQAQKLPLPARPKLGLVDTAKAQTWVVEMDGVMAPLQDGAWQEVKCGVVYRLDQRVEVSPQRWELLKRERCVLRGSVADFRERLWATLLRAGARLGDRMVVIADGAEWIDQTVTELFVGATRILDFYHVAERIWQLANLRYGEGAPQATAWAEAKLSALKAGQFEAVCRAITQLQLREAEAQLTRRAVLGYFRRHRAAMAYDQFRAAGLPIGSGAIEGTCKHLVAARCKQSGMRWSEAGLDSIVALRCWVLNDRLDELCPKPIVKIEWAKAA